MHTHEPTVAEIWNQQDEAEAEEKRRAQAQAALRGDREDLGDEPSPF